MNELQGTVYVQTPFAIYANTALEDVREIASNYSTRNANNILQVRSFPICLKVGCIMILII